VECFITLLSFNGEELLAPRPTPKLRDYPLSAVHDCLFSILAATLHIWRPFVHPQSEDVQYCGDRDPLITVLKLNLIFYTEERKICFDFLCQFCLKHLILSSIERRIIIGLNVDTSS